MASRQNPINTYYRPYLPSDSETSDADTDYSYTSPPQSPRPDNAGEDTLDLDGIPDFSALAAALKGPSQLAGPSFETLEQNDAYAINRIDNNTYGSFPSAVASGDPIKMQTTNVPTVIILQSLDRDKRLFPQPTDCRLMLPRVYQNVGGFSIAQINLTSAFFYFNSIKANTQVQIYEKDRIIYNPVIPTTPLLDSTGNTVPLKPINTIRNGSYDINSLMAELNLQLNRTPLFYDFINGFSDFLTTFPISGDLSLNFNEPGDTFFDSMSDSYIPNPTREIICSHYFQARYVLQTRFSVIEMLVAYYYPVLKEILLDSDTKIAPDNSSLTWNDRTVNLTYIDPATQKQLDVYNYVLHFFTGLNDPVVQTFVNIAANVAVFDNYRINHTFRYSLVNQYSCTADPTNNRVTIQASGLNTSLSNFLNNKYNSILLQQIAANNLTLDQYNNLANTVIVNRAIYQQMYTLLQNSFTTYFAVDYGTYTAEYYVNSNNTFVLRPGINAFGVSYTYNPAIVSRSNDIMNDYKVEPPSYWPYMTSMPGRQGAQTNMGRTTDTFPTSSNYPYNLSQSNIDLTRNFVDSNGYIYTDYRRKCGDILVNVEANKYTIFKFRSQYRQSLQVETLPRQTNFRYPVWNKDIANRVKYPIQTLFDVSYCYIAPDQNTPQGSNMFNRDISFNAVYGWSNDIFGNPSRNFGTDFATSASYWTAAQAQEQINIANPDGRVYSVRSPFTNNAPDFQTHKFSLNITFVSANPFPIDYYAFLYHDIAALAADVSDVGRLKENPNNYKQKVVIAAGTLSNTVQIGAYQNQTYYTLFRPSIQSPPATFYTVVPWMPNSYFSTLTTANTIKPLQDPTTQLSNYFAAIEADPDFIRLPIQSTLWADNTPANSFLNLNLSTFITPIGYDQKGVSTDLTDYIPFFPYDQFSTINPAAKYCVDPITNYLFQNNTPYDTVANSYFGPNTANAIFTEAALSKYTPSTVTVRQYKIAQYYNTTFIHDPGNVNYSDSSINHNFPPYNVETTGVALGGYTYSSDESIGKPLQLGEGVCGYTFLPSDGIWEIDRMTFKTNFTVPGDPGNTNNNTHCLAIFYTSEIFTLPINYAKLSNALGIYLRTSERTYSDGSTNLGFDSGFGTYYTFTNFPALVSRTDAVISGFTQNPGKLITDLSSYYSIVAFTIPDYVGNWTYQSPVTVTKANLATATVATMQNLVGTPIPYPFGCAVSTSSVFYDGSAAPSGFDMVLASAPFPSTIFGPAVNYGDPPQSVSQYQQSIPFVNSHLHYKSQQNIITNSNGFTPWTMDFAPPYYICTSVVDPTVYSDENSLWVTGYAAFQRDNIVIGSYKIFTSVDELTDANRNFTYESQLSVDQIFPLHENTYLIAISGNTSNFVFLGVTNTNYLRFKTYDPVTGVMTSLPDNPSYIFGSNYELQHFVVNGSNGWYYSAKVANTTSVVLVGTPRYTSAVDIYFRSYTYTASYTELQMPIGGKNLYFAYYASNGFSNYRLFPLDPLNPKGVISSQTGYQINLDPSPVPTKPYYTQMLVTLNNTAEEVLLTSPDYDANVYYKIRSYAATSNIYLSNTNIDTSAQLLTDSFNNTFAPTRIYGGGFGSKWLTTDNYPYVYGNRNDAYDAPTSLGIAWQIFFPTVKIEMRKTGNTSTPITDLTGLKYPEWPHTCMFSYSNYDSMIIDISQNWGLEKNFMTSDTTFSGFYFNSYMLNVPLQNTSTQPVTNSNAFTYVAVRGYLPTESFQCLMRFNLPNRYDFGFVTETDLINEIELVTTNAFEFNPSYANTIERFDSNFQFSNVIFGASSTQGLPGSNVSSSNFGDFLSQYVGIYSNFSTNSVILQKIQSTLAADMNFYISTNLQYILPPSALVRTRFTDPLLFQVLWQSYLTPGYSVMDDNWGLGWNLGFAKNDTGFSTYQVAQSFYKIQSDYIYLKLNQEFNINGMDAGAKEDYGTSREPTGSTKQYYCKLLLTGFGGNATTFIHNPITFNPPLNRITNLHFQWIDTNGLVINNNDCDWNMTVTLTESYETPVLPDKMPFKTMTESDMEAAPFGSSKPPPTLAPKA